MEDNDVGRTSYIERFLRGELICNACWLSEGEEAVIAKVEEPGSGTHYELRGVPESGKARLEALFQVFPVSQTHRNQVMLTLGSVDT